MLQLSKINYRSIFDNLFDGVAYCRMVFDDKKYPIDFVYLEVSTNFEKLTGLKNVVGKKVTELIPGIKETNPEIFKIYGQVSLTGQTKTFDVFFDFLKEWFTVTVYSIKKGYFTAVFQNISQRKKIEKKLENAKIAAQNVLADLQIEKENAQSLAQELKKFKLAIDNVSEHIVITDPDGIIIFANPSAEKITGFSQSEMIGRKVGSKKLWGGQMTKEFYDKLWLIIKKEKHSFSGEIKNRRKNGENYYASSSISPILNHAGEVKFFVNIERDITKEKEIDRAKTEFVSLASHQLKTPPTAIKLLAERILSEKIGKLTPKQKEYILDIQSSNQRMINLVNTLLNVSRIELGEFSIQVAEKNICGIVEDIFKELAQALAKKKLKLKQLYPLKNLMVLIDEPLFRIAIGNLANNAINFSPNNGLITVEVAEIKKGQKIGGKISRDNCLAVIISDNGCGIPKNQQSKIFNKFFRADNAQKKHPNGSGLGLYIVKSIIENSGGSVWFVSPAPPLAGLAVLSKTRRADPGKEENKGSSFYVTIPIIGMKKKIGEKQLISF